MYEFLRNPASIPKTDPTASEVRVIVDYNPTRRLMYIGNSLPFPLSNRDCVFMQHETLLSDGLEVSLNSFISLVDFLTNP